MFFGRVADALLPMVQVMSATHPGDSEVSSVSHSLKTVYAPSFFPERKPQLTCHRDIICHRSLKDVDRFHWIGTKPSS